MLPHYQSTTKNLNQYFKCIKTLLNYSRLSNTFYFYSFVLPFLSFLQSNKKNYVIFFDKIINPKHSFLFLKFSNLFTLHPLAFQQLSMRDFKRLNLIDLPFGNKKIEKFVNKEKKNYIKEIKVSSLVMKFGGSLLDFRNENGCCTNICYREKR